MHLATPIVVLPTQYQLFCSGYQDDLDPTLLHVTKDVRILSDIDNGIVPAARAQSDVDVFTARREKVFHEVENAGTDVQS